MCAILHVNGFTSHQPQESFVNERRALLTNTSSLALPITSIALAGTNPWAILADQHLRRRSECGRNLHDQRGVSSDLHWG
jgi:hypothetical protein